MEIPGLGLSGGGFGLSGFGGFGNATSSGGFDWGGLLTAGVNALGSVLTSRNLARATPTYMGAGAISAATGGFGGMLPSVVYEAGGNPGSLATGDLNGDGFPDAVAACANGQLVYFQNPGGKVRGWPWPRNVIPVAGRSSFVRVFLADINRDGRPEVIAANEGTGAEDGPISWFEAPRDPMDGAAWREHELIRVRTPTNCYPVDIDGDGDLDIFVGSRGERLVVWLENLGGAPVSFRNHAISLAGSGLEIDGSSVAFHDFNGDRRLDVVTTTIEKSVVWLEQPEDPAAPWKPHQIGTLLPDEPAGLAVADINGDRRPDVMVGSRSRGPTETDGVKVSAADPVGRLAWFECPENPSGIWKRNDILRLKRGSYEAFVPRDLDRDGDADFIATRGNSGEYDGVFWLEQVRSKKTKTFTAVRQSESERLPIPVSESK